MQVGPQDGLEGVGIYCVKISALSVSNRFLLYGGNFQMCKCLK